MYKIGGAAYWRDIRQSLYSYNRYIQADDRSQAGETWYRLVNHLENDLLYLKNGYIDFRFVAASPRVDLIIKRIDRFLNSLHRAWSEKNVVILL